MIEAAINYTIVRMTAPDVLFMGWFYLVCWYVEGGFYTVTINGKCKRKWRWF
jgi:hypothetical protein